MGAGETGLAGLVEATLEYHPSYGVLLTREQALGPCLVGSLTGAVASQMVTEARNGSLRVDGNHLSRVLA